MRPTLIPRRLTTAAVAVLLAAACSDDGTTVTADDTDDGVDRATQPSESADLEADTPWHAAELSEDGMTLMFSIGGSPEGDGPCEQRFEHSVTEDAESVTVAFDRVEATTTTTPEERVLCNDIAAPQRFEVTLVEPLGDRPVFDGTEDQARSILRRAEIVEATVLPQGADDLVASPNIENRGGHGWSQSAQVSSGPGWDLWIDQHPEGSFVEPSTEPGAVVTTTTVRGIPAQVWEYFNHTGRMVHWVEGGLDITVRAELHTVNMDEPMSWANPSVQFIEDEILAVAEGIVLP